VQKKLAAWFLVVALLYLVVHLFVARLLADPLWSTVLVVSLDVAIGLGAASIASRTLTRRIRDLAAATSRISAGDLTRRVHTSGSDETADLARSFSAMVERLLTVIHQVQTTAGRIQGSARDLLATSEEMNRTTSGIAMTAHAIASGAEEQARQVAETAGVTRRLVESVDTVAACADGVHEATRDAAERASAGAMHTRSAAARIAELSDRTAHVAEAIEGFRARASRIGRIVTSISTLSHQTHLLAINAAIEAVRAGENGQGFAVVADEVGRLAEDVRAFAQQISEISAEITDGSGEVAGGIRGSVDAARAVREVVDAAATSFDGIVESIAHAAERAAEIRSGTAAQAAAAASVSEALDRIHAIARNNVVGTEQASEATSDQTASMEALTRSAYDLAGSSEELRLLVSVFRVEAGG